MEIFFLIWRVSERIIVISKFIKVKGFWAYIFLILKKNLIVLAEGRQKDDGGYAFKTVDPFPPLWTLTTNIHHSADT